MMSGQFFRRIFGRIPETFPTIPEVDKFVEEATGKELEVGYSHLDICSCGVSVFEIKSVNVDKRFDDALAK